MDIRKLKSMLIRHEGLKLKVYRCPAGKLTIGVGRNLEDNGISFEEADFMLDNDIIRAQNDLGRLFPDFEHFSGDRQIALIDMGFNLGPAGFRGFHKMVEAILAGDWEAASREMLDSKWAGQVGVRARELAAMVKTG